MQSKNKPVVRWRSGKTIINENNTFTDAKLIFYDRLNGSLLILIITKALDSKQIVSINLSDISSLRSQLDLKFSLKKDFCY